MLFWATVRASTIYPEDISAEQGRRGGCRTSGVQSFAVICVLAISRTLRVTFGGGKPVQVCRQGSFVGVGCLGFSILLLSTLRQRGLCTVGERSSLEFRKRTAVYFRQKELVQKVATSGFEMCFAIGSQHLWCPGSQPKHVSNPA